MKTAAPSAASALAVAAPIPWLAPVTRATFPSIPVRPIARCSFPAWQANENRPRAGAQRRSVSELPFRSGWADIGHGGIPLRRCPPRLQTERPRDHAGGVIAGVSGDVATGMHARAGHIKAGQG